MRKTDVTEYVITSDKFNEEFEGYKFALLTDLHANGYGIDLHYVNKIIKEQKPDAILIAGDMFNKYDDRNITDTSNFLCALANHYPVFYSLGNHEYKMLLDPERYGMYFPALYRYLMNNGICFLELRRYLSIYRNIGILHYLQVMTSFRVFICYKGTERIALSGVSIDEVFYNFNHPVMGSGLMEKHLGVADRKMFNLLLAHNPEYFINYAKWGADLTLSGHVHGGIVRIGKAGVLSTNGTPFPKYDGNIYMSKSGKKMIVSRGMGTHTVKVRINNRPELVIVKILAKK